MTLLVTGASGFVGAAVCDELRRREVRFRVALRSARAGYEAAEIVGEIGHSTDWSRALDGIDCVLHVAGLAHLPGPTKADEARLYEINTGGTRRLAESAAAAGVRSFIYVSTAKVSGDDSGDVSLTESDPAAPAGAYATSKHLAELALRDISRNTSLAVAVVRPPLVYGPGVRANFLSLMNAVDRGVPLPLGGVENRRSLIYVGNLADALVSLAGTRLKGCEAYFVKDGDDVSSAHLARLIARSLGSKSRVIPVPRTLIESMKRFPAARGVIQRLYGSMSVSDEKLRSAFGWIPPYTMEDGLGRTAAWYRSAG